MVQAGAPDALTAPARLALGFAAAVALVCIVTAVWVGRLEGAEIALLACASVALAFAVVQAIAALAGGQARLLERLDGVGARVETPAVAALPTTPDVAVLDDDELKALLSDVQDEVDRRRGRGAGVQRPDRAAIAATDARLSAARAEARDRAARRPRPAAQIRKG